MSRLQISGGQGDAICRAYGKCQQPEQAPRFHNLSHALIMTDVHCEDPPAYWRSRKEPRISPFQCARAVGYSNVPELFGISPECPQSDEMMHNRERRQNPHMRHFRSRLPPWMHGANAGQFSCREIGNADPSQGLRASHQLRFLGANIRWRGYKLARILRHKKDSAENHVGRR